jgi:hypothetical protein
MKKLTEEEREKFFLIYDEKLHNFYRDMMSQMQKDKVNAFDGIDILSMVLASAVSRQIAIVSRAFGTGVEEVIETFLESITGSVGEDQKALIEMDSKTDSMVN